MKIAGTMCKDKIVISWKITSHRTKSIDALSFSGGKKIFVKVLDFSGRKGPDMDASAAAYEMVIDGWKCY